MNCWIPAIQFFIHKENFRSLLCELQRNSGGSKLNKVFIDCVLLECYLIKLSINSAGSVHSS